MAKAKSQPKSEMTVEEAVAEIRTKPVVRLWPTIGKLRGISKGAVYAAAERGEIDVLKTGRLKLAVSASERRKLGIEYSSHRNAGWRWKHMVTPTSQNEEMND
jgi:hypothetical protein